MSRNLENRIKTRKKGIERERKLRRQSRGPPPSLSLSLSLSRKGSPKGKEGASSSPILFSPPFSPRDISSSPRERGNLFLSLFPSLSFHSLLSLPLSLLRGWREKEKR